MMGTVAVEARSRPLLARLVCRAQGRGSWRPGGDGNQGERHPPVSSKKPAKGNEPTTVVADDPEDRKGLLKTVGGSQSDHWNNLLANQAAQALWIKNSDAESRDKQLSATVAALIGIGPKDELEGMMAAQLIARDGERPLPDARGNIPRRSDR